jgi:hypothetical protein
VLIAADAPDFGDATKRKPSLPKLDATQALRLHIPQGAEPTVVYGELPKSVGARPGLRAKYVIFADSTVELDAIALVPLADELPPPPPKPWEAAPPEEPPAGPNPR